MSKQDFEKLVQRLCELGEDKSELNLWLLIYDDLEPDEQREIDTNLQDELKKMESTNEIKRK